MPTDTWWRPLAFLTYLHLYFGALWLPDYMRHRSTLTYLLTYLLTSLTWDWLMMCMGVRLDPTCISETMLWGWAKRYAPTTGRLNHWQSVLSTAALNKSEYKRKKTGLELNELAMCFYRKHHIAYTSSVCIDNEPSVVCEAIINKEMKLSLTCCAQHHITILPVEYAHGKLIRIHTQNPAEAADGLQPIPSCVIAKNGAVICYLPVRSRAID